MRGFINYNILYFCGVTFVQSSECLFRVRCLPVGIQNYPTAINQQRMLHKTFTSGVFLYLGKWSTWFSFHFQKQLPIHQPHHTTFLLQAVPTSETCARVFRVRSFPRNEASAPDYPSSPASHLSSAGKGSICSFQGKRIPIFSLEYPLLTALV